ncbi:MAG: ECF transporter S component [Bacillota bacterium]
MKDGIRNDRVNRLTTAGMLCALIVVLTIFVSIPIPGVMGAYLNAGDVGVYLTAYLLGGPLAALVGGVGSALADLIIGSAIYAPATLLIKAATAFTAALLFRRFSGWKQLIAPFVAGLVMCAGYFLYECLLYGAPTAAASILFNLIQMGGAIPLTYLCVRVADGIKKRGEG